MSTLSKNLVQAQCLEMTTNLPEEIGLSAVPQNQSGGWRPVGTILCSTSSVTLNGSQRLGEGGRTFIVWLGRANLSRVHMNPAGGPALFSQCHGATRRACHEVRSVHRPSNLPRVSLLMGTTQPEISQTGVLLPESGVYQVHLKTSVREIKSQSATPLFKVRASSLRETSPVSIYSRKTSSLEILLECCTKPQAQEDV